jgi:hypothetical protein
MLHTPTSTLSLADVFAVASYLFYTKNKDSTFRKPTLREAIGFGKYSQMEVKIGGFS